MKKVLFNAKVYVEKSKFAEDILVEDDKIFAVGSNDEIKSMVAYDTEDILEIIDCEGKTLIPGLNDSHLHFMQFGETRNQAIIDGVTSIEDMINVCKEFANTHTNNVKEGLHAIGWNQDNFIDDKRIPNKNDLDKISIDFPIVLERVCGHIVSTNSRLLEILDIDNNKGLFKDGDYLIGEDGKPNGIFTGNGCNIAKSMIPDFSLKERRNILIETMKYAVEHGITSVQSNDVGTTFMYGEDVFNLFHDIYDKGEGLIRYRHQVCFNKIEDFKDYLENGEYTNGSYPMDSWLTLGPLKLFKDGSLGARTALLTKGYIEDPSDHGLEWISVEDMDKYCELAKEHGIQVVTHVIGDEAVKRTLDSYEKAFIDGKNKLRHALIHCQITSKELIDRITKLNILVFAQPIFLDYDMKIADKLVGKELASTSYAFGSLARGGAHVAYGTDCPVEDCNPFPNISMAVTRKDKDGKPENGYYPNECVDVETAIDAYTLESAYGEFMEDIKGRIKPGYLADVVLLDKDIFTVNHDEIKEILPVMTMVGGKIVFRR